MKIFKPKLMTTPKDFELGEYSVNDVIFNNNYYSSYEKAYECLLRNCKDVDSDEYIVLAMIEEDVLDSSSHIEYIPPIEHIFQYENNTLEKFDKSKVKVNIGDWIVYSQGNSLECGLIGNIHNFDEEDDAPIYIITEDSGNNDCSPHSHINYHNIVAKVDEKIVELILPTKYIANIKRRYVLSQLKIEVYKQDIKDLDKQIKGYLKK